MPRAITPSGEAIRRTAIAASLRLNLQGQRFGWLVAVSEGPHTNLGLTTWNCLCDCGNEVTVMTQSLRKRESKSCGCKKSQLCGRTRAIHNQTNPMTPAYSTWRAMRARCNNPNGEMFKYYGGRGIKVCERWGKFANFYTDMGDRPPGMTIDRKDNDGNYEPDNCKWSTPKEQQSNKRQRSRKT